MQIIASIVLIYLGVLLVIAIVKLYFQAVGWFFLSVAPPLLGIGGLAFSAVVIVNYVKALCATLGASQPECREGDDEPAFRSYFFGTCWSDLADTLQDAFQANVASARRVVEWGGALVKEDRPVILTWPLAALFFIVAALGVVLAAATYVLFGLLHVLVVLSACLLALLAAFSFYGLERLALAVSRIFVACPHCYKKIALPVHRCPRCHVEHRRLLPGNFGTFQRRCRCGYSLPTLLMLGRARLESLCPHCNGRLGFVVARNLHFPVVAGPSSGKTSYLSACMVELRRRSEELGLSLDFPDAASSDRFSLAGRNFAQGLEPDKTREGAPDHFRVQVTDSLDHQQLLYVYDAAGELFNQEDALRRHDYYGYLHGIIFLIDPFALDDGGRDRAELSSGVRASSDDPGDVYSRMIQVFRELSSVGQKRSKVPVAVVVTKTDACGVGGEIRAGADLDEVASSQDVRRWLDEHGAGNVLRDLEHGFEDVRCFACSALGRSPDASGKEFAPRDVLDPLLWLMQRYGSAVGKATSAGRALMSRLRKPFRVFSPAASASVLVDATPHDHVLGALAGWLAAVGLVVGPWRPWAGMLALLVSFLAWRRAQAMLGHGAWSACLSLVLVVPVLWIAGVDHVHAVRASGLVSEARELERAGRYSEACDRCTQALALREAYGPAVEVQGTSRKAWSVQLTDSAGSLLDRHLYADARRLLKRALELDPSNRRAEKAVLLATRGEALQLTETADALRREKQYDAAGKVYREALTLDRDCAPAKAGVRALRQARTATLLQSAHELAGEQHDFRSARQRCLEALALDGDNAQARDALLRFTAKDMARRLLGRWQGRFSQDAADLDLARAEGNGLVGVKPALVGVMAIHKPTGTFVIRIAARFEPRQLDRVEIRETEVLRGQGWALGVNGGEMGGDRMAGSGRDTRGNTYSWWFRRR